MVTLNEYLGGAVNKRKKLISHNKEELRSIIEQRLEESLDLDLNDIDVSGVKDMKNLFEYLDVSSVDISGWDIDVIGKRMFYRCRKLKSIILPDSVKKIENNAFAYCKLTKINIPNSVKSIESCAFDSCSSLTKISISDSVESIGTGAFAFCSKLTDINIPDSVNSIGYDAFYNVLHITYHGHAAWESDDEYWGAERMN